MASTTPPPAPRRGPAALLAVLGLLLAVLFSTGTAAAGASESEGERTTYTIGTDSTFAPFEFRGPDGELTGIDVDLMEAIAERRGFEVEWESIGFNAALQALSSNQVDGVIAGMGITDERRQIYDFSDPYFTSELQLAVPEGNEEIASWEDLEGKTVAVKSGSLSEDEAKKKQEEIDFEITSLDQSTTMVQTVKSGNADALMDDRPVLAYGVTQGSGLKLVAEPIDTGDYGFAVNKDMNGELLAEFDAGLAELKESGEYDEIVAEYLGDASGDGTPEPPSFFEMLGQIMPALLKGLQNTLLVTGIAFTVAMVLGLAIGFMKISGNALLRGIANVFINVFRGTPLLVWAFFFYFGLPGLIGVSVNIWVAGVLTLALNGAAYIAEIVRGGIQSVDVGQSEAARSLGLGYSATMRRVVLPQAFTIMTPSLINQLIIMLKDSSLLLAIGFTELLYQAQQVYASNFRVTEVLLIVAAIYFAAIWLLTQLANVVERKINK